MKYTGLCEKYTPIGPLFAAYTLPAAINAPLTHLFNIDAGISGIVWAGTSAYLFAHIFGKPLTDLYLRGKQSEYGATRASKICRKIQTACATLPMSCVLAFSMAAWDGKTMPEDLAPEDMAKREAFDERPTTGIWRYISKYH